MIVVIVFHCGHRPGAALTSLCSTSGGAPRPETAHAGAQTPASAQPKWPERRVLPPRVQPRPRAPPSRSSAGPASACAQTPTVRCTNRVVARQVRHLAVRPSASDSKRAKRSGAGTPVRRQRRRRGGGRRRHGAAAGRGPRTPSATQSAWPGWPALAGPGRASPRRLAGTRTRVPLRWGRAVVGRRRGARNRDRRRRGCVSAVWLGTGTALALAVAIGTGVAQDGVVGVADGLAVGATGAAEGLADVLACAASVPAVAADAQPGQQRHPRHGANRPSRRHARPSRSDLHMLLLVTIRPTAEDTCGSPESCAVRSATFCHPPAV